MQPVAFNGVRFLCLFARLLRVFQGPGVICGRACACFNFRRLRYVCTHRSSLFYFLLQKISGTITQNFCGQQPLRPICRGSRWEVNHSGTLRAEFLRCTANGMNGRNCGMNCTKPGTNRGPRPGHFASREKWENVNSVGCRGPIAQKSTWLSKM